MLSSPRSPSVQAGVRCGCLRLLSWQFYFEPALGWFRSLTQCDLTLKRENRRDPRVPSHESFGKWRSEAPQCSSRQVRQWRSSTCSLPMSFSFLVPISFHQLSKILRHYCILGNRAARTCLQRYRLERYVCTVPPCYEAPRLRDAHSGLPL